MSAAHKAGAAGVLSAINRAEPHAGWWQPGELKLGTPIGDASIRLPISRGEETKVVALSPRQAEWISVVLKERAGAFTNRPDWPERIDLEILNGRAAVLVLPPGFDRLSTAPVEILIQKDSADAWMDIARQARAAAQNAKDDGR